MTKRALAVGPAIGIHLKQPQIDTKLDFIGTVFGFKSANHNLAGLIIPLLQEVRNIEVHARIWTVEGDKSTARQYFLDFWQGFITLYLLQCSTVNIQGRRSWR